MQTWQHTSNTKFLGRFKLASPEEIMSIVQVCGWFFHQKKLLPRLIFLQHTMRLKKCSFVKHQTHQHCSCHPISCWHVGHHFGLSSLACAIVSSHTRRSSIQGVCSDAVIIGDVVLVVVVILVMLKFSHSALQPALM